MRSIFDFISFPGMADQGGGSEKVLSFSIDYSWGETEDLGCIRGAQKMQISKFSWKSIFSSNLHQNHQKSIEFQIKIDFSDS